MGFYCARSEEAYYAAVRRQLQRLGQLDSILDIGCWDSPVATWGAFSRRYTIDTRRRPALPDVTAVVGSWPEDADRLPELLDVITCLQTLEHIDDAAEFAAEMFRRACRGVLISVPWMWPAGTCPWHVHDPVDDRKLFSWTGRRPDALEIVGRDRLRRAVAWYEA